MNIAKQNYGFIKNVRDGLATITITEPSGQPHTINSENGSYESVLGAWRAGRKEEAVALISVAKSIKLFTKGVFEVIGDEVFVQGRACPDTLATYILDFQRDGLDFSPLVKFAENLFQNPSYRSVQQLFSFLQQNEQPITEDGCFIAYKRVGSDFLDLYTHTMNNAPGQVLKMNRSEVDDDPNRTCSKGLHVANWHYACNQYGSGQGVMLSVKVNPAHVVAVPTDYNQAKMRVCEYTVVKVVEEALSDRLVTSNGDTATAVKRSDVYNSYATSEEEEDELDEDELDDEDEGCPCADCVGEDEDDEDEEEEEEDDCPHCHYSYLR